jgi:hypothetical protein
MALSRLAEAFAAEIRNHDWSDAPWRADRAGHDRSKDSNSYGVPQLTRDQTDTVRLNVMWVTAQVLGYLDPNLDVYEFAEAAGVNTLTARGERSGHIHYGLRHIADGRYCRPGTWDAPAGT